MVDVKGYTKGYILTIVVLIIGAALFPTLVSSLGTANFTGTLAFIPTILELAYGVGLTLFGMEGFGVI